MRLIKMFGLAVIAAIASMAFLGASSAMAQSTALCTSNEGGALTCASPYTGHVEATAGLTELKTGAGTVTCENSHILGNALGLVSNGPLVGHLELVSFTGNCKLLAVPCEVKTKELGLLKLLKTGANVGSVTSEGTWVVVKCGTAIHCEYGGTFAAGTAKGSEATLSLSSLGTVTAAAVNVQVRKALELEGCPATAEWSAKYTVQLPHALFIKS